MGEEKLRAVMEETVLPLFLRGGMLLIFIDLYGVLNVRFVKSDTKEHWDFNKPEVEDTNSSNTKEKGKSHAKHHESYLRDFKFFKWTNFQAWWILFSQVMRKNLGSSFLCGARKTMDPSNCVCVTPWYKCACEKELGGSSSKTYSKVSDLTWWQG